MLQSVAYVVIFRNDILLWIAGSAAWMVVLTVGTLWGGLFGEGSLDAEQDAQDA
jgi:hypothetical protein